MFDILRFPNASSMKLPVYGASYWYGLVERMDDVIHTVLPGIHAFPKLALLDIGFGFDSWGHPNPTGRPICTISIPFAGLVNLNHLILSTHRLRHYPNPGRIMFARIAFPRTERLPNARERMGISVAYASYHPGEFLAFATDGRRL